ncbi:hypothetical protein [Sphingomonas sp. LY160]|uniref:hypothetical protein n=1 Tax=Sphingomonas sp. LY160 TaxID=3095342 RepID=UPI002ADEE187|nr:hypothetical protein [Sphingomonas sp. LY160]MEA1072690.1 hypothetical protein [Sphingomonas sp. LY160]
MRFILPAFAILLLAACGGPPPPTNIPAPVEEAPERGDLIGLDANGLVQRFGTPRLQVKEGVGTKFQFTSPACILDAYLYASGTSGVARVTHVDTRNRAGNDIDQGNCIAALQAR